VAAVSSARLAWRNDDAIEVSVTGVPIPTVAWATG
jgi:hypothetical protein